MLVGGEKQKELKRGLSREVSAGKRGGRVHAGPESLARRRGKSEAWRWGGRICTAGGTWVLRSNCAGEKELPTFTVLRKKAKPKAGDDRATKNKEEGEKLSTNRGRGNW